MFSKSNFLHSRPGIHSMRILGGFLILLLAPSFSSLQSQETAKEKPQREIPVVYETLKGKFSATLKSVTAESTQIAIGEENLSIDELIEIEFSGQMADSSASASLYLRNG